MVSTKLLIPKNSNEKKILLSWTALPCEAIAAPVGGELLGGGEVLGCVLLRAAWHPPNKQAVQGFSKAKQCGFFLLFALATNKPYRLFLDEKKYFLWEFCFGFRIMSPSFPFLSCFEKVCYPAYVHRNILVLYKLVH